MKNLKTVFAAAIALGAGIALAAWGITATGRARTPDLKAFNPIAKILKNNGLEAQAKADPRVNAICAFNAPAMADSLDFFRKTDGLIAGFYACSAIGYAGYDNAAFNQDIINPPAGKTATQVEEHYTQVVDKTLHDMCSAFSVPDVEPPSAFDQALCRAVSHPIR